MHHKQLFEFSEPLSPWVAKREKQAALAGLFFLADFSVCLTNIVIELGQAYCKQNVIPFQTNTGICHPTYTHMNVHHHPWTPWIPALLLCSDTKSNHNSCSISARPLHICTLSFCVNFVQTFAPQTVKMCN